MGVRKIGLAVVILVMLGISSPPSLTVIFAQEDNQPPTIEPIPDHFCLPTDRLAIPLTITDPDGDAFSVDAIIEEGTGVSIDAVSNTELELSCEIPTTVSITIIASDSAQSRTHLTFSITVMQPNVSPTMREVARQECEPDMVISTTLTITDENNDEVSLEVMSRNAAIATGEISANDVLQISCKQRGLTNIIIGMDDGHGGYNEGRVVVAVGQIVEQNAANEQQNSTILYVLVIAFLVTITVAGYWVSRQD